MSGKPQIGKAIALTRYSRGMSQKELAEAAGLSYSALSQLEHDNRNPSWVSLLRIAEVLKLTPSQLVRLGELAGSSEHAAHMLWSDVVSMVVDLKPVGGTAGKVPIMVDERVVQRLRDFLLYGPLRTTGVGYTEFIERSIDMWGPAIALLRRLTVREISGNYHEDGPAVPTEQ